jgi:prepilin-type N-terminal cleavage/methylation domain-containing protein
MSTQRTRPGKAGYTLVEVMLAVSVLTVGLLGFTSMQSASSRATIAAQESMIALSFQEAWVDRVRLDALRWSAPGTAGLANTEYLKQPLDEWYVPEPANPLESWAVDFAGRDTVEGSEMRFCVNLRNTAAQLWNQDTNACGSLADVAAMRVDVRVWWYRSTGSRGDTNRLLINMEDTECKGKDAIPTAALLADRAIVKSVTSTIVRPR